MAQVKINNLTAGTGNSIKKIFFFIYPRINLAINRNHLTITKLFSFHILVFFFISVNYLRAQWVDTTESTPDYYRSVYFFDPRTGYVAGGNGEILFTDDGGLSWIYRKRITNELLDDICFVNRNLGYIVGTSGTVLKTYDGGINWSFQNSNTIYHLGGVSFINENTGMAAGGGFFTPVILRTTDGGLNWINQPLDTNLDLYDICQTDENRGFAVGNRTILRTKDGGITWIRDPIGYNFYLYSLSFPNSLTGYTTGGPLLSNYRGCVLRTTDGGNHWYNYPPEDTVFSPMSIYFCDSEHGYTVGWFGKIYKTTNAGLNWILQNSGTDNWLYALYFINENTGWVVGEKGTILHTSNGGINWTLQKVKPDPPAYYELLQNYPNPFNSHTKIIYKTPVSVTVKLTVYDILGKEIKVLENQHREPGTYGVYFDASGFSSGIYFCRIITEGFTVSKKMILIK